MNGITCALGTACPSSLTYIVYGVMCMMSQPKLAQHPASLGTVKKARKASAAKPTLGTRSRMRKTELVAECEAIDVSTFGSVLELRARLRAARKLQDSNEI